MNMNALLLKTLKFIHILGAMLITGGFIVIRILSDSGTTGPEGVEILYKIYNSLIGHGFWLVVTSAVLMALFTQWGLFRHWWIIAKWILTGVLFVVVWSLAGPAVSGAAALAPFGENLTEAFIVRLSAAAFWEILILMLMILLSVFKPWGQRKTRRALSRRLRIAAVSVILLVAAGSIYSEIMWTRTRNLPVADFEISAFPDSADFQGNYRMGNMEYPVIVRIRNGRIANAESMNPPANPFSGYASYVFRHIVREQTPNTDIITGATTTSKCYMKAVENALESAGIPKNEK